ncbi:MBL fold metallo-hydrolase [Lysinibacillus sp. M3]|uniref:MBL fold metallo-hydrolase n=2 Tax=Lysinibacillus zambalensis TaxID=3160866 RepID=A0ABV1MRP3_9BACI
MLKFIGSGSAFNTKLGNNSAYYKEGNQMLLIDCGSNIFQRIKENNLLQDIEHIHVLITHTHADHVGSLADLILYTYYSHGDFAKNKITVYSPKDTKVCKILKHNGCVEGFHFTAHDLKNNYTEIESMSVDVTFNKSNHVKELISYSIDLVFNNKTSVFYSGDISELKEDVITYIESSSYISTDIAYIDTCIADYKGNVHLSLRKLSELIKPEYRHKVWCMHLDEGFIREEAEALGFNVVSNEL